MPVRSLAALLFALTVLAAVEPEPMTVATAPLAAFLPPERTATPLPAPVPRSQLVLDLGGGRTLVPAALAPVIDLDGEWRCSGLTTATKRFADDAQLDRGWQAAEFDDRPWDSIAVPLDWYRAYPKARSAATPYVIGWYRRAVDLGPEAVGKRPVLRFGVAGYEADLWVNGHLAGSHHGDFTPWEIDIGEWAVPGRNVLALRVRSDMGPKFGAGGKAWHAYGSQWSIGNIRGGLWQSCRLTLEPSLRITELLIAPRWEQRALRVDWRIDNRTGGAQRVALRGIVQNARNAQERPADVRLGEVEVAPGPSAGTLEVPVPGIHAWSPDRPELYWLGVIAEQGEAIAGFRCERFGFRSFTVQDGGFRLNGVRTYLFGENLSSLNYGGKGESRAVYAKRVEDDLLGLKASGYTIFRTAHMPVEPQLLERADELGLMVYDEWAWGFTDHLDPVEFPRRNDRELGEWVRRDCNHPSVVMWSCGNEVHYDDEAVRTQLDRQVAAVRALDRSGRPVSSFSGAAYGYGSKALDTDVLDRHSYFGLGGGAWSGWERNAAEARGFINRTYGEDWAARKPFIIWECVGFSWGQLRDPAFRAGNADDYLAYAGRQATWGAPAGIGFAGTAGLAAFLDPARGLAEARRTYGRRIAEFLRRDPQVSGFAPWFIEPGMAEARQWTQPVFASLYGANRIALRHPIGGRTYSQTLLVVNDGSADLGEATARLSLAGADGPEREVAAIAVPPLAVGQRLELPISFRMPEPARPGWCQLRLRVAVAGQEVSRLGYDLFAIPGGFARSVFGPARPVAVLGGGDEAAVRRWLGDLGIQARTVTGAGELPGSEVVIVPPGRPIAADEATALRSWIRTGGDALVLEQPAGPVAVLGQNAVPAGNTFVDLVQPAHPLFAGLPPAAFDTSDHPGAGWWVAAAIRPFTANALAARGAFLGLNDGTSAVIAEGTLGSGRILCSQLLAVDRWDADSVATVYLANLARYLLAPGAEPVAGIRPWQEGERGLSADRGRCRPLDLRGLANRGFSDDVDGDGQGGWTDQGGNDFRDMPLGPQTLQGVPFTIIDPAANGGRSCMVLGGAGRPAFPREISGIAVGGPVSRLFFLHTAAWGGSRPIVALTYRIRYADGSLIEVPVRVGTEIADWWNPCELRGALLGLSQTNGQLHDIALFLMPWDNPRPDVAVAAIDVVSSGEVVPVVVAITAESAPSAPARFATAGDPGAWNALIDWPGGAPGKSGPGLPLITASVPMHPGAAAAVRIAYPESPAPVDPKQRYWGAPTAFLALPVSERAAVAAGTHRTLTFWARAEEAGTIDVVLPFAGWKDTLHAAVHLDPVSGWKKVRLDLARDLQQGRGKSWKPSDLLGELFLFHGRRMPADGPRPKALTVHIADPRLE